MRRNNMTRYALPGVLLALIMAVCLVTFAEAAPAAPIDTVLTQPNGTTFIARQWGDEWQNGYETKEGYTILQLDDGWWVYAGTVDGKALTPALLENETMVVGQVSPDDLTPYLRPQAVLTPTSMQTLMVNHDPMTPNTGTQPVLVLLVSFSDRSGTYTAANFASSMFGASNSVKDFYLDSSFNQLTLAAATETYGTANDGVIGWLNLGYPHPNTGASTSTANQTIVKNALIAADPYVNYASFDTDGNGYISNKELHLVVVVAGYEYSMTGSPAPSIWAHRWNLNNVTPPMLDGKILGDYNYSGGYAQFGEIHSDSVNPQHQATIGVMAHELGHDLTWPDLYDTDNSSEGVGNWSIMGSGSWNYVTTLGDSPAMPDAWLKWYQGWIAPTAVNGTLTGASFAQAESNAKAYLLRPNPGGVDWNFYITSGMGEYFLVENRQKTGYDAGLPGCGLLIWHIDESVAYNNSANANEYHPLIKLIEADGLNQLVTKVNRGDPGDPFPGSTVNRTFTYSSTPNSRLYSGADSLATVTNISTTCAATMTADLAYTGAVTSFLQYLPVVMGGMMVVPTDPIRNGTFEAGADGNWTEYSTHGWSLITQTLASSVTPHAGTWAAWLGGDYDDTSQLTQAGISLVGVRYLHYWYWIASADVCGYDYARVKVNGTPIKSYDLCTTNSTGGWVQEVLDLNSYIGTSISLQFEVTTDASDNSNFFLDDVSITTSALPVSSTPSEIIIGAADPK
jgi:M6 family metalloprotease-like protein